MDAMAPVQALTEDGIKTALIEARGDIFVAAQLLSVTAIRVKRAIDVSPLLQISLEQLAKLRASPEAEKLSTERIEEAVRSRLALYRVAGLDALHDLATMPIDENSAQNQVKLAAAARLAGSSDAGPGGGDIADTLRALNDQYQKDAPRIRLVRETLTIEHRPPERDIPGESQRTASDE